MHESMNVLWQHDTVDAMTEFPMQCTNVFSIELSEQDLAGLHDSDLSAQVAAPRKCTAEPAMSDDYDLIEIELTPQEMDALLSGG